MSLLSFSGTIGGVRRPSRALLFVSLEPVNAECPAYQVAFDRATCERFEALASLLRVGCVICGSGVSPIEAMVARDTIQVQARDATLSRMAPVRDTVSARGAASRLLTRISDGSVGVAEAAAACGVPLDALAMALARGRAE